MPLTTTRQLWFFVTAVTGFSVALSLVITALTAPFGLTGGAVIPAVTAPGVVAPIASYWAGKLLLRINKLKQQEEETKQVQARFFATMSHEIRTPINGIMGLSEVLLESELSQDQRVSVHTILSSSQALLEIVNDVLDHASHEAGAVKLEMRAISLRSVVHETASLLSPVAKSKGVHLIISYPPDVPDWVTGDAGRLRQIILNILGNAIKFTLEGQIEIAVRHNADAILPFEIAVKDQGIGIAEDKLDQIFDAFQQGSSDTARLFQGTGLGLAITRKLVRLMNGEISVTSELGIGSTFLVRLPLEQSVAPQPEAAPVESCETTPAAGGDFSGQSILIADDNRTNRTILDKMLRPTGAELTFCTDGAQALEAFCTGRFDIVLLDMSMPRMDGVTAARAMRAHEVGAGQPAAAILALTANAMGEDRQRCFAAGMNAFLSKPIRKADLIAELEHARSTVSKGDQTAP